jgi:hypothetical protein
VLDGNMHWSSVLPTSLISIICCLVFTFYLVTLAVLSEMCRVFVGLGSHGWAIEKKKTNHGWATSHVSHIVLLAGSFIILDERQNSSKRLKMSHLGYLD